MGNRLTWEEKEEKRRRSDERAKLIQREAVLRDARFRRLMEALQRSGQQAYDYWHQHRTQLVKDHTLAADVVVTPLAWVPQWPPPPLLEPLPPTPTVLDAAQVAADLLLERPPMSREDYVRLGVLIARMKLLHSEMGWQE